MGVVDLSWLGPLLGIEGRQTDARPHGSGHIHETYVATYASPDSTKPLRLVHQRINTTVFDDPVALMDNLVRVTDHLRAKLAAAGVPDLDRRVLTPIRSAEGDSYLVDGAGSYWRTFHYIADASTYDVVETSEQAFEVARAFGAFQAALLDLPAPRLADTIPGFHDTPRRWAAFRRAVERDACNRAVAGAEAIRVAEAHAALADSFTGLQAQGLVPERIAHNDTKINNVLIDDVTAEAVCVIDLDTVMPGRAVDDFGELVRTSTSFAREDDPDLSKAVVETPLFEALARGYLDTAASFLTPGEIEALVLSGKVMTFENAIRFLADYLDGDPYFRVHRPEQNLDRARVQFALLASIEEKEAELRAIVENAAAGG